MSGRSGQRGDASGLVVHQRPYARVIMLNCWEHQMVLPSYALMAQGVQVHAALNPGWEPQQAPPSPIWPRQLLLSRAFAAQGACYVVLVGGLVRAQDIPEGYGDLLTVSYTGDSAIIGLTGEVLASAPSGEETILTAHVSLQDVRIAKLACDVAGHYSRPDVFTLEVNRRPASRIRVISADEPAEPALADGDQPPKPGQAASDPAEERAHV